MNPGEKRNQAVAHGLHQTVTTLPEVMAALGTRARRTAFRKL